MAEAAGAVGEHLGRRVAAAKVPLVRAADHDRPATRQRDQRVLVPGRLHPAGARELARPRVEELGAPQHASISIRASGDQHLSSREPSSGVPASCRGHRPRGGEGSSARVVDLGGSQKPAAGRPADDQHPAAGKRRSHRAATRRPHRAGGYEPTRRRDVELGGRSRAIPVPAAGEQDVAVREP
jgi:hypothetical protein